MTTAAYISIKFPYPTTVVVESPPSSSTGFSVEAQGTGSFTGLSYTVPAHTKGKLKAKIQVLAITSSDVEKLNTLVKSMLEASRREKIEEKEKTTAKADLSIWSLFGGGGSASATYEQTKESMRSMGLTDEQISDIIDNMFKIAAQMSNVELDFDIENTNNDYSVSGDLQLYTISGKITTSKGTVEYRLLANKGTAGRGDDTTPATGKVIPLS